MKLWYSNTMIPSTSSTATLYGEGRQLPELKTASELIAFLESLNFEITTPVDVDRIAQLLDIDIAYDSSDSFVGKIEFTAHGRPVITVNPTENSYEPRRRFTIAHEIGHFCLHSVHRKRFVDTRKNMSRSESYWDSYEYEANAFAAELLMPEISIDEVGRNIIDEYVRKTGKARIPASEFIDIMATRFKVSNPAMEYRLKNLGILKR